MHLMHCWKKNCVLVEEKIDLIMDKLKISHSDESIAVEQVSAVDCLRRSSFKCVLQ